MELVSPIAQPVDAALLAQLEAQLRTRLKAAARKETALHHTADAHVPGLSTMLTLAFQRTRAVLKSTRDEEKALDVLQKLLARILPPILLNVLRDGGDTALEMLQPKGLTHHLAAKVKFGRENKRATEWAREHAGELISEITDTTRKRIQKAIADLTQGGDWGEAVDAIADAVGDEERAQRIAHHETMSAASEGQRLAWEQAHEEGLLDDSARRMWIAVGDEKTCPVCAELDGQIADLDGEYRDGVFGPPAHVSCRCTEGIV